MPESLTEPSLYGRISRRLEVCYGSFGSGHSHPEVGPSRFLPATKNFLPRLSTTCPVPCRGWSMCVVDSDFIDRTRDGAGGVG